MANIHAQRHLESAEVERLRDWAKVYRLAATELENTHVTDANQPIMAHAPSIVHNARSLVSQLDQILKRGTVSEVELRAIADIRLALFAEFGKIEGITGRLI